MGARQVAHDQNRQKFGRCMSRPLLANATQRSASASFHKAMFDANGGLKAKCVLCRRANATDAAHVVSRVVLGKHRFADPGLARPACRSCHEKQTRHEIDFPIAIRRSAIKIANDF
jgi:hypothetical protein